MASVTLEDTASATEETAADPRAELAQATERLREAKAEHERAGARLRAIRSGVFAAKRKLDAAKAAAASAVEEHGARIAEAAVNGLPAPPAGTIARFRDAERDCADEVAAIEAAALKLTADLPAYAAAEEVAAQEVERAIGGVIALAAKPVLAKAQRLQVEIDQLLVMLMAVFVDGLMVPTARGADPRSEFRAEAALLFAGLKKRVSMEATADGGDARKLAQQLRESLRRDHQAALFDFK